MVGIAPYISTGPRTSRRTILKAMVAVGRGAAGVGIGCFWIGVSVGSGIASTTTGRLLDGLSRSPGTGSQRPEEAVLGFRVSHETFKAHEER
ncbi:MAG: hypothetical protein M3P51_05745 [Chloroflexota bacterium]|nr:hypothetical protein [Chloroflexota bacterium]